MYCKNCGDEIDDKAVICPHCGVSQKGSNTNSDVIDSGGFGWGLLGCCIPVVGLILFLVWKDSKPRTSKAAGIGALVALGCYIAFYVLMFVVGMGAASSVSYY